MAHCLFRRALVTLHYFLPIRLSHNGLSWDTHNPYPQHFESTSTWIRGDRCWWPLFHILTVNLSGINWALHYVPFIFYLILISFTSFGWVLISGEHMPKWMDLGKIPGRPTSPRPAGLAPPHTVPHLQSRGNVTRSSTSESRIGCWFNHMDRKACTRIKGPTIQCKDMSKSAIHLLGRSRVYTCNVGATEGRGESEGGRPA
jgi:hypothetical protein